MNRGIFERYHLIASLLKLNRAVRIKFIAEKLEVSKKTVHRDLDFMIDRLELPISKTRKGVQLLMPMKLCPTCIKRMTDD